MCWINVNIFKRNAGILLCFFKLKSQTPTLTVSVERSILGCNSLLLSCSSQSLTTPMSRIGYAHSFTVVLLRSVNRNAGRNFARTESY